VTIFDIASRHGRRIGWYAGVVVFAVLFASYILPQSEPKAPPFALTVGYLMVAVAAWGFTAAVVYFVWLMWAGGIPVPEVYDRLYHVYTGDATEPDPGPEHDVPQSAPVRDPAYAVNDGKVRHEFRTRGARLQKTEGDLLDEYPDLEEKIVGFLATRPRVLFGGRALDAANVVSRDKRDKPNSLMVIEWLEGRGYIEARGNSQYILSAIGEEWVGNRGGGV